MVFCKKAVLLEKLITKKEKGNIMETEKIALKLSNTDREAAKVKRSKEKLAIKALRKARIYIRVMNTWGKTHILPFKTVCKFYTIGNELESIDFALKTLDYMDKDLPSSRDFDFDLSDLKE